jgi:hypothetical protein
MESQKIKVYVKLDESKVVKQINSSIFLTDINDYIEIDEGYGDKYSHAQSQYLEKGLIDNKGRFNYKFDGGLLELAEEEKENLFPTLPPQPTSEQQLTMEMTMAMAQMQMDNMIAIAELTNLIMAMGGM